MAMHVLVGKISLVVKHITSAICDVLLAKGTHMDTPAISGVRNIIFPQKGAVNIWKL